jgi:ribonuclease HI
MTTATTSTAAHQVGSNNTGELSAVCEALRWITECADDSRRVWAYLSLLRRPRPHRPRSARAV